MSPSSLGELVSRCWKDIPQLLQGTTVDEFAMMPDHLHGILALDPSSPSEKASHTLSSVVGAFKSRVSRLAAREVELPNGPIWQRGFHDRVIRGEKELFLIRRYIRENGLATTVPPRIRNR